MQYSKGCDSKGIDAVSLYVPKFSVTKRAGRLNVNAYHVLFALVYLYQAYWCLSTAGGKLSNVCYVCLLGINYYAIHDHWICHTPHISPRTLHASPLSTLTIHNSQPTTSL